MGKTMNLKAATIIGSDKGGVGKSLLANLLVQAHDVARADVPDAPRINVVEVDHQRRLSGLLGEERISVSLPATASIAESAANRWHNESRFNSCYSVWSSGDSITDLGANTTTSLMDWARHNSVRDFAREDGVAFRFVAVATPDDLAIRSAQAALRDARDALGGELFLVLNDTAGGEQGYLPYENGRDLPALLDDARGWGAKVIRIPYCDCMLFAYARARGYTVVDFLRNKDNVLSEIRREANLDPTTERFQLRRFTAWVSAVQTAMDALFSRPGSECVAA
jgi:hypothetical protein